MFSKEILKRVAQASRDAWTKLDIATSNLNDLPAELYTIISLRKLDVSGNNLHYLPPEINRLLN